MFGYIYRFWLYTSCVINKINCTSEDHKTSKTNYAPHMDSTLIKDNYVGESLNHKPDIHPCVYRDWD